MNFLIKKASLAKSKLNFFITKKEIISLVLFFKNNCKVNCGLDI